MHRSEDRLPDFLVIGAMKCGTTSLHSYLAQHPHIDMAVVKEPHFFNTSDWFGGKWELGLAWYRSLFPPGDYVRGEASTGYTKQPLDPLVAQRIYTTLPWVKLVYIVRDPIIRAASHYLHNYSNGSERRRPSECLLEGCHSHYLNTSRYFMQLSHYLKYFDHESIFIVSAEELRSNREQVLEKLFAFLGVDTAFAHVVPEANLNVTLDRLRSGNCRLCFSQARTDLSRSSIGLEPLHLLHSLEPDADFLGCASDRLADALRDDVECLRRLTQRSFCEWRHAFA